MRADGFADAGIAARVSRSPAGVKAPPYAATPPTPDPDRS